MDVEDLKFEKAPPLKGRYDYERIAKVLQDNPGKWALAFRNERYSVAMAIIQGSIKALRPEYGFRVQTDNNVGTGRSRTCDVWLSYQPAEDQHVHERLER